MKPNLPPEQQLMQFRLRTIFLVFLIIWCAMAAFGPAGICLTAFLVLVAVLITKWPVTVMDLAVTAVIGAMLAALLVPAIQTGLSPESRRDICARRMKVLALGLRAYHEVHGCFPPTCCGDATGRPMHSWRALALSHFDNVKLQGEYVYDEPWNGPKNRFVSASPSCSGRHGGGLCCPNDPSWWRTGRPDTTSFFAVVGERAAWRGSATVKRTDLPKGGRRMILLIEAAGRDVNWKEPKDLTIDEAVAVIRRRSKTDEHGYHKVGGDYFHHQREGTHVAFVDGSVHFLPTDIAAEDLQLLLTGDTSRSIDLDAFVRPSLNWSHIVGLTLLVASGSLLVIGSIVQRRKKTSGLPA
ncbi:MAG: DUF1559 domain-containing protein [Planctomycetaceae bacterium]|nr:DUF1559 domain-containing protein [Planctomycetaceae bacterium]